ncbi:hypothetical protein L6164_029668 [Bauhinia variegata]|uniref:Uncharacterized protein n=1 Tax=Bauhinia variegata TaxID=167791 RepID=A0ACB9LAF0_BAUVA|nr:hypothetical protein L6164_029668 [Bauhinia variegata]
MSKCAIIIVASALCFLSFFGLAHGIDKFYVKGSVYCDTCRVQFLTRLSEFMPGATVKVECRDFEGSDNITFSEETVTDAKGGYSMVVDGDHEEELCQVVLMKSSRSDCNEMEKESFMQSARVSITGNNGIVSPVRNANPLGFLKKERLPECLPLLDELGINEDGTFKPQ